MPRPSSRRSRLTDVALGRRHLRRDFWVLFHLPRRDKHGDDGKGRERVAYCPRREMVQRLNVASRNRSSSGSVGNCQVARFPLHSLQYLRKCLPQGVSVNLVSSPGLRQWHDDNLVRHRQHINYRIGQ